jgi:L-threonylcarbamoyladenylate synthase
MTEQKRAVILPSAAPRAIEWAAERIASGGVIALPTDTVYGIAASLSHPDALERIYELKGRPAHNPLPVLVSSSAEIEHIATGIPPDVALLLDLFWPGPLTIVLDAKPGIPARVTAGGSTIGVRMPNHPLAIEVIAKAGGVVACTSANLSGQPPACSALEVENAFGAALDLILDGGQASGGVASTVAEVNGSSLTVIREGAIAAETLQARWSELLAGHTEH